MKMNISNQLKKINSFDVAIAFMALLTVLSIVFYKERMFFVDPCWVAFNMIHDQTFVIAENRYGSFISQILPLAGIHLGLSVKSILLLYSFNFYAFYFSVAFIVGKVLKQKWMTILMAFYFSLFVSDVYFWPNNEVHQGVAWMFLFLALSFYPTKKQNYCKHVLLFLFMALSISSHLIVAVVFLFLWTYLIVSEKRRVEIGRFSIFLYSALLLILIFIRYRLSDSGWYDPVKLAPIKSLTFESILQSFSSGQAKTFGKLFLKNYWLAGLVFMMSCALLVKSKQKMRLLFVLGFALGYFILITITFPQAYGRELVFYMESEWAALSIIIATPFAIWLMKQQSWSISLVLILVIRLTYIFVSYDYFHVRYENLENALAFAKDSGHKKGVVVESEPITNQYFIMDWGLPIESMMLSKVKNDSVQTTVKIIHEEVQLLQAKDSFYSCFDKRSMDYLNSKYFVLDTLSTYIKLEPSEIQTRLKRINH